MENHEIVTWMRKILRAEYYVEFSVDIDGKTGKTQGYASDVVFLKVALADQDKKRKEFNLAVKFAKKSLIRIPLFKDIYKRELIFYDELLEIFKEYQMEKNITEPFDAVAKCHTTYSDDNMYILVLENLTKFGFSLHPRELTMNLNHIRLILKNFAKFHALSFSLKHQKPDMFKKIVNSAFIVRSDILLGMGELFQSSGKKVLNYLKESNRTDLFAKFNLLVQQKLEDIIARLIDDDVDKGVIIHSDCHCNNFMFQYKDGDTKNPSKVAILDWQIARYHSPAIDISYLLYSIASKAELSESMNLLKYYHEELTTFLTELGEDANLLFSFSDLMEHWRKYSIYSFIYACCFMDFNFVKDEDAPSLDHLEDESTIGEKLSVINLEDTGLYKERLFAVIEHYFDNINLF